MLLLREEAAAAVGSGGCARLLLLLALLLTDERVFNVERGELKVVRNIGHMRHGSLRDSH
jgi:hypothetical protein